MTDGGVTGRGVGDAGRWRHRLHAALAFRAARALGRPEVTVAGAWGRFVGYSDDEVMLRHYGRRGTWATAVVEICAAHGRALSRHGPVRLLDVGAGIGLVAVGVARQAPVTVEAFEPHPESYAFLCRNLEAADLAGRAVARRVALGTPRLPDETVALLRRPGNGGDCRAVAPDALAPDAAAFQAPLRRLDEVVERTGGEALLVKVDVQGAEPEVLEGASRLLAEAALIVVEFWPFGLKARGHNPRAFARRLLAGGGSAALLVDEHRPQSPCWVRPGQLLTALEELAASDDPAAQAEVLLLPGKT